MELVEANEAPARRDALGDLCQRIGFMLEGRKLRVDVAHERVKMNARLAADADARAEAVHQERLAATDATPQVDALRNIRRREQPPQRRFARFTKRRELVCQLLETIQRRALRVVERGIASRELGLEIIDERA